MLSSDGLLPSQFALQPVDHPKKQCPELEGNLIALVKLLNVCLCPLPVAAGLHMFLLPYDRCMGKIVGL